MRSITIAGNVGQDPETKYFENGQVVSNFSVAVRAGKDKATGKDKTLWFKCAAWGKVGEVATNYLKKGSQVSVSGELDLTTFTSREGEAKASLEVRVLQLSLLGSKADNSNDNTPDF